MSLPNLKYLLQNIIATPSISSVLPDLDQSNAQIIHLLANWLEELKFKIEICPIPMPNRPEKLNLIATLGQNSDLSNLSDSLVLAGHTDTVPYESARWTYEPLQLTEKNDRFYGLGISDMKSFFAFVIEALRDLNLAQIQRPLVILATADEESSMCGAQAILASGRKLGRHALIGEPTELRPIRMHKGIAMESIRITGQSGHASDPNLGNNALEGMYLVLGEILRWRNELQANNYNKAFQVPVPTLNLGHIHGGDSPNRICGHCELHIDLRPLPGMHLDILRAELETRLYKILANTGLEVTISRLFEGIPAMETPANAPIIKITEALTRQTAGAVAFGTEAPYLDRMGMQTVILGPGSINQAHQPDEFLAIEHINPYIKVLKGLIHEFCVT